MFTTVKAQMRPISANHVFLMVAASLYCVLLLCARKFAADHAVAGGSIDGHRNEVNVTDPRLYATDEVFQISRVNKLIFVHIPKTGGSTIESSSIFNDARKYHAVGAHSSIGEMRWHTVGRGLSNPDGSSDFTAISVIRHPCTRFISAVNYMKNGRANKGDKVVARHFDIIGKGLGINAWVAAVKAKGNMDAVKLRSVHFRDMTSFLIYGHEELGVDELFCQEQFDEVAEWLHSRFPVFPRTPPSKLKENHVSCSDLDEETRLFIEQSYALDYCVFNYETGPHGADVARESCAARRTTKEEYESRYHNCKVQLKASGLL